MTKICLIHANVVSCGMGHGACQVAETHRVLKMEYIKNILKYIKYFLKNVSASRKENDRTRTRRILVGIIDLFPYPALFKQALVTGVCAWCMKCVECAPNVWILFLPLISIDVIKDMASC